MHNMYTDYSILSSSCDTVGSPESELAEGFKLTIKGKSSFLIQHKQSVTQTQLRAWRDIM